MQINKNVINDNEQILLKRSRRYFFKFVGLFSSIAVMSTFLQIKKDESSDDQELFLVDGWVLKKGDIHDL